MLAASLVGRWNATGQASPQGQSEGPMHPVDGREQSRKKRWDVRCMFFLARGATDEDGGDLLRVA